MEKAKRKQIDIEWNQRKEASRFHNLALLGVNHISRATLERLVSRKSRKYMVFLDGSGNQNRQR